LLGILGRLALAVQNLVFLGLLGRKGQFVYPLVTMRANSMIILYVLLFLLIYRDSPINQRGLEKLFAIKSFAIIIVRKFMIWSIIALLFFSSLSFAITMQWSQGQRREIETQAFVIDGEPLELSEEPEFQDLDEPAENEEPQTPTETMESMILQNSTETIEDEGLQNSTETAENEEPQTPTEVEPPAFDSGKVKTVGVAIYSDSSISNPLYSIDWGNLEPEANTNIECYIQNTGDFASLLTLETDNWIPPEAANYITLTWDYDGQTLNIDEVIHVTLTLSISENIKGIIRFFFDINIIGSGI